MAKLIATLGALLSFCATSYALPVNTIDNATQPVCVNGLYMILVRSSNAPVNGGILLDLVKSVTPVIPDSTATSIPYPATTVDYMWSESQGVLAAKAALQEYTTACPQSQIALIGYSQGAQVVGDLLVGNPQFGNAAIDPQYTKNVVAVVMMGDPSYVTDQTFDRGNATLNGVLPRSNSALFAQYKYSNKMLSYCDFNDMWCASGNSTAVHHSYIPQYLDSFTSFIHHRSCKRCRKTEGADCNYCQKKA